MRFLRYLVLTVVILAVMGLSIATTVAKPQPFRAIITFDGTVNESAKDKLIAKFGGVKVLDLDLIDGRAVVLPSKADAGRFAAARGVKAVREDKLVFATDAARLLAKPEGKGGGKISPPQPAEKIDWGVDRIDADNIWGTERGAGVKVAVLDTGIQLDHPDLAANIGSGYNAVNSRKSANDDNGHGTHVAGTIGAVDNTIGVIGAANEVTLHPVKVLNKSGMGFLSYIIAGIQWAIDNDMDVINMSLGSNGSHPDEQAAIQAAYNAGITIVAAAGNDGGGVDYPAAYAEVIAVSAVDNTGALAGFSSRGAQVDLAAPGVNVLSTYKGSWYAYGSGTSMASPHVAGTAALIIGAHGPLTPAQVRARLKATAEDLGLASSAQGAGLVDAEAAVSNP